MIVYNIFFVLQVREFNDVTQEFLTELQSFASMYMDEQTGKTLEQISNKAFKLIRLNQQFMPHLLRAVDDFRKGEEVFKQAYEAFNSILEKNGTVNYIFFEKLVVVMGNDAR